MIDRHHGWNQSYKPLFLGYILSIIFLLGAYRADQYHLSNGTLILTLFALAIGQGILQLIFFFHIGLEKKPKWNITALLFTVFVLLIIVGGSLWIMYNLDYNLVVSDQHTQ